MTGSLGSIYLLREIALDYWGSPYVLNWDWSYPALQYISGNARPTTTTVVYRLFHGCCCYIKQQHPPYHHNPELFGHLIAVTGLNLSSPLLSSPLLSSPLLSSPLLSSPLLSSPLLSSPLLSSPLLSSPLVYSSKWLLYRYITYIELIYWLNSFKHWRRIQHYRLNCFIDSIDYIMQVLLVERGREHRHWLLILF